MSEPALHRLADGDLAVLVSPRGGSLRGVTLGETEIMVAAGGPNGDAASFPLVPFGNRVEFNRFSLEGRTHTFEPNSTDPLYVHGDGWLMDWTVEAATDTRTELRLRHHADATGPYDYSARQTISVEGNSLTLDMAVTNEAAETMPFGLGQHPFFVRTPKLGITAAADRFWFERAGHLPGQQGVPPADLDFRRSCGLPDRFINNAFGGWNGQALIAWPELGVIAEVETTPRLEVFMLYAPTERTDFFCLEPMTHLPNGHHMEEMGGLTLLRQGETLRFSMTIKFRRQDNG